jgi:hypothetical protein
MSRAPQGDVVFVRPSNNMYTVLAFIAFLLAAASLGLLFLRAKDVFGPNFSFFS